jgi:hypothetical protein
VTYDEFRAKLRETPRDWIFHGRCHSIRRYGSDGRLQCPISSLCNVPTVKGSFAAHDLGLGDLWYVIANAADCRDDTPMRRELLSDCGLAEPAARKE